MKIGLCGRIASSCLRTSGSNKTEGIFEIDGIGGCGNVTLKICVGE